MSGLVLAILAHNARACLEDQIANLRACAPGAHVVVFNGGTDPRLTHGLDIDVCPYSRPLAHHRVGAFHGLVMTWLVEQDADRELLVTLDSDMLLLKPGLERHLVDALADRGYMGAHFGEVLPTTPWRPGRRFHRKWAGAWQELFGLPHPFRAFNPGQVFARQYVRGFAEWSKRSRLMQAVESTRLDALDEIVWPTLAMTLGVGAVPHPSGRALQLRRHSPREIVDYAADPDVFLLHRVGMQPEAPDRRLVRQLAAGATVDPATVACDYPVTEAAATPLRRSAARVKDVVQAATPAARRHRPASHPPP